MDFLKFLTFNLNYNLTKSDLKVKQTSTELSHNYYLYDV